MLSLLAIPWLFLVFNCRHQSGVCTRQPSLCGEPSPDTLGPAVTENAGRRHPKSFSAISGIQNFLGRWNGGQGGFDPVTFNGQIDEFRVWKVPRSEAQIRETIFKKLTGQEEGLVGLWNFDDPAQPGKDSSPNAYHGKLVGQAAATSAELPIAVASVMTQRVLSLDGKDSYVELPAHLFTNEVVTVEGWVKWREPDGIYGFGGFSALGGGAGRPFEGSSVMTGRALLPLRKKTA